MADINSTGLAVADSSDLMATDDVVDVEDQKSGFAAALGNADMLRQVTLIIALAICLAIAVSVILWANQPEYRVLAKLPTQQLIQTMDLLDASQVDYRQENNTISVPVEKYQEIKIILAREGLGDNVKDDGDMLMKDMGFGVSQRLETERLKYNREQQIAHTITEFKSIARAKVLLAIPRSNVFSRQTKRPSATIVLTLRKGNVLSEEEVDSVVDVVASAVQGLTPSRVTVTDQNGRLLNSGSQNSISARARKELDIEQKREKEYLNKIDSILIPVIGLGNYTAQIDITMDFSHVEQTKRSYNPDLPSLRSEMKIIDNNIGGVLGGIPGALTNQPPVESSIPEQAAGSNKQQSMPSRQHSETTKNYELDESISHTKKQSGVMRRLSISVALDYTSATAESGDVTQTPRSAEEIANIRRLLQGSVGFNLQRGDVLEVVTLPFNRPLVDIEPEIPIYEKPEFMKFVKLGMGALVIIILILAVVRPMIKRLMNPGSTPNDYGDKSLDSHIDLGDETMDMLTSEFDAGSVGFAADGSLQLPDLHRDEDVLKAVRALVANEPELSSQVVKSWLTEDE